MKQHAATLETFCKRIFGLNKLFEPLGFMSQSAQAHMFNELRRNTALFAQAYQSGMPHGELAAQAKILHGNILAAESLELLSTNEAGELLDALDVLIEAASD